MRIRMGMLDVSATGGQKFCTIALKYIEPISIV